LSYNLLLNSGKQIRALPDKKKNILTLVLFEKKFRNETKNHNPLLQVKWSVPNLDIYRLLQLKLVLDNIYKNIKLFMLGILGTGDDSHCSNP
jgi:hypothetical protein